MKKRIALIILLIAAATVVSHAEYPKYLYGYASWYGDDFNGRITASGEVFDSSKMTAAHRTLPFGTVVEVENLENGNKVIVTINDRGPFVDNRFIDVSRAAADELGFTSAGTAYVKVTVMKLGDDESDSSQTTNVANGQAEGMGGGNNRVVTLTNYVTLTNRSVPILPQTNAAYTERTEERDIADTQFEPQTSDYSNMYIIEEPVDEPNLPVEEPELRLNPWYVTNRSLSNTANVVDLSVSDEELFTPDVGSQDPNVWVTDTAPQAVEPTNGGSGDSYVIADESEVTPEVLMTNANAEHIEDVMITNEAYREFTFVPSITVTTQSAGRQTTTTTSTTTTTLPPRNITTTTTTTVPPRNTAVTQSRFSGADDSNVVMDAYGNSYTVQVGAFSREQNALALYDKLKRFGYDVYMKEAIVNNTRFIRVRVGFFASMQEAQTMAAKLKQLDLPTQIVHLRYLTE